MVSTDVTNHTVITLSAAEVQCLADRLYSRGISTLSTCDGKCRTDLVTASRVLRELLRRYERDTGRTIAAVTLNG